MSDRNQRIGISAKSALRCLFMAAALVLSPASAQPFGSDVEGRERVVDRPLKDGEHQRVLYLSPEHPWATVVMLP